MHDITEAELWTFKRPDQPVRIKRSTEIRKDPGHLVPSFLNLARKVATLTFLNQEHVLLFRGQGSDPRNQKGNSTIKPTLFRPVAGSRVNPASNVLEARFAHLLSAEQRLVEQYESAGFLGITRLRRHRILRWAILQHYEVCRTPLLDVTQSLRVAASFASLSGRPEAYVHVIGVPAISGAVTASIEAGVEIVRLASVCPPDATRPHLQEGYLLGEYPELIDFGQKGHYDHHEIDFGRRLVAKFRFSPRAFWNDRDFPKINQAALYPRNDPLRRLTDKIKAQIGFCP